MSEILIAPADVKVSTTIDVDGLGCPLPLLRAKKSLAKLSIGDVLQVNGMQENFRQDLLVWCERNGHFFLGEKETYGYTSFFLKKG